VVTLSGFVESQAQAEQAVTVAKGVEGVASKRQTHVRDGKNTSAKGYAGDTATTSEIKAKLLADDIVPSRKVKVETTDGVVQLSGTVDSQAQIERAESIAKAVDGVKSVKNDLKAK
jgi:hyperosmotically inducible protein